jgi:hypothetical protein
MMKPYQPYELETGKRLNPPPRRAPRVYTRSTERSVKTPTRPQEFFALLVALFATLGFATLCIAIA